MTTALVGAKKPKETNVGAAEVVVRALYREMLKYFNFGNNRGKGCVVNLME